MNELRVIHPYKHMGTWVFDDETVGLVREPFVFGADTVIEHMVASIPGAEEGFTLIFSDKPFPQFQLELEWRREEFEGNWYYSQDLDMEGWLCPALLRYFETSPPKLYAHFKARSG
jgi:hypothetical protein